MNPSRVTAYIGLGSNIGRRAHNMSAALARLRADPLIRISEVSRVYETSPIGPRQRNFLNAVVCIRTAHSPKQLLAALQTIEKKLGRKKRVRWGPRIMDMDLLFYERRVFRSARLTVPHPEFSRRKFVLAPLSDIAPRFRPPGFKQTVRALAAQLTDPSQKVKLYVCDLKQ